MLSVSRKKSPKFLAAGLSFSGKVSSNPHATISNLPITSSNPQVMRLKARVGRLNARVKALKAGD